MTNGRDPQSMTNPPNRADNLGGTTLRLGCEYCLSPVTLQFENWDQPPLPAMWVCPSPRAYRGFVKEPKRFRIELLRELLPAPESACEDLAYCACGISTERDVPRTVVVHE